ncbi:hypothetical protein CR513_55210, partial [Mucuna pruriens]
MWLEACEIVDLTVGFFDAIPLLFILASSSPFFFQGAHVFFFLQQLRTRALVGSQSDPCFTSFAGESSRDPLDAFIQGAHPSSGATPEVGASNKGGGSSSSSESYDNYPFEIWYRDHTSDNVVEDPYSWVDQEVLRVSSVLTWPNLLLRMASAICQPKSWSVSVSPCR